MFDGCVYDVLNGARCLSTPRQCFTSAYWPAITHGERIVSCTKTAANNVRPIIEGPSNLSQLKIGLPRPTKTQKNEIIFHVSDIHNSWLGEPPTVSCVAVQSVCISADRVIVKQQRGDVTRVLGARGRNCEVEVRPSTVGKALVHPSPAPPPWEGGWRARQ